MKCCRATTVDETEAQDVLRECYERREAFEHAIAALERYERLARRRSRELSEYLRDRAA